MLKQQQVCGILWLFMWENDWNNYWWSKELLIVSALYCDKYNMSIEIKDKIKQIAIPFNPKLCVAQIMTLLAWIINGIIPKYTL